MSSERSSARKPLRLDEFCLRQWEENYSGSRISGITPENFERKLNEMYSPDLLKDGYAPFCKHIFVKNFIGDSVFVPTLPITPENSHLLCSGYQSRRSEELPVLSRWFPKEKISTHAALYLDVILYSHEQVIKENEAMGNSTTHHPDYDWGIISIKTQDEDFELPMSPMTILRNALGKEEGGSGVPINREVYLKAVEYWSKNAIVQ